MDDNYVNYGTQDASMYTDAFDSTSYKVNDYNNPYEIDESNDLSFTREKDYAVSSEKINSETNIFPDNNNVNISDNIVNNPCESQLSIFNEENKHKNYDSENSNTQNDEYLFSISQDNINKDDSINKNNGCCSSADSMMCLDACCTCFCL